VIISNIVKILLTLICIFGGISPGVETKRKFPLRIDGIALGKHLITLVTANTQLRKLSDRSGLRSLIFSMALKVFSMPS
jgi:hypothetical protein